jgi:hypothetical protein
MKKPYNAIPLHLVDFNAEVIANLQKIYKHIVIDGDTKTVTLYN